MDYGHGRMHLVGMLLLVAVSAGQPSHAQPRSRGAAVRTIPAQILKPDCDLPLSWLPEDTELYLVARGPFTLRTIDYEARQQPELEILLEGLACMPLSQVRKGRLIERLSRHKVALAIEGARRFRMANGLGLWPYEGCHIVFFQDDLPLSGKSLRKVLANEADKVQVISGHETFVFEEKAESENWRYFFSLPDPRVLLCATDARFLAEVLERMNSTERRRARPADLPEWKLVNRGARFWAIRHLKKNSQDPNDVWQLSDRFDGDGLTMSFDPGSRDRSVQMHYIAKHSQSESAIRDLWSGDDGHGNTATSTVRRIAPQVIEARVEARRERAGLIYLLLICQLGHAFNL